MIPFFKIGGLRHFKGLLFNLFSEIFEIWIRSSTMHQIEAHIHFPFMIIGRSAFERSPVVIFSLQTILFGVYFVQGSVKTAPQIFYIVQKRQFLVCLYSKRDYSVRNPLIQHCEYLKEGGIIRHHSLKVLLGDQLPTLGGKHFEKIVRYFFDFVLSL